MSAVVAEIAVTPRREMGESAPAMNRDPACLFIDVGTLEGNATGLLIDSVVSSLVLDTVYTDTVAHVLGSLLPARCSRSSIIA
jgi:hypothetical protein